MDEWTLLSWEQLWILAVGPADPLLLPLTPCPVPSSRCQCTDIWTLTLWNPEEQFYFLYKLPSLWCSVIAMHNSLRHRPNRQRRPSPNSPQAKTEACNSSEMTLEDGKREQEEKF